jgi:hypothetical protein
VHVFEDYETQIERRWWLRGEPETKNLPPSRSTLPNRRACRATATKDFDDKMGDPAANYKAVIFNPVPGPPMGQNTRLSFRYWLQGADHLRVQIYSLTNNYHRRLVLNGLTRERWESAVVDMTTLRRPDGSGGPLSEDERIDDIQFYIDPAAELVIDDIVLFDANPTPAKPDRKAPEPFPARIIFTGWFDTGKQGAEWPGDFEIVPHEPPRTWKAARPTQGKRSGRPMIRVGLRGRRPLGERVEAFFRYKLTGPGPLTVRLRDVEKGGSLEASVAEPTVGEWAEARVKLTLPAPAPGNPKSAPPQWADAFEVVGSAGSDLLIDDLLIFEPASER